MNQQPGIDCNLLSEFIDQFYGYGSYEADYWFIGIEEGGGKTPEEIQKRLDIWSHNGKQELEDVVYFHNALSDKDVHEYFVEKPVLQKTWHRLILMILTAENGTPPDISTAREYQQTRLGRTNYHHSCLLEFQPLPSPSAEEWMYKQFGIDSREVINERTLSKRVSHLRQKIAKYNPKAVVFYSLGALQQGQEIAGGIFTPYKYKDHNFYSTTQNGTKFLVVKHPMSKGMPHEYYYHIGQLINSGLKTNSL